MALFGFGLQLGGLISIAWLLTYLEQRNALSRGVLSSNRVAGNPNLAARQEMVVALLAARGFEPREAAAAAVVMIQEAVQAQVAELSSSEGFLVPALLLAVAEPNLVSLKITLNVPDRAVRPR